VLVPSRRHLLCVGLMVAAMMATIGDLARACTIGVASGRATADGRPLLWKVRDNAAVPDNEVYHNTSLTLPFIAVVTADGGPDSPTWMGTNRHGFALVNADAGGLADPPTRANGEFMRTALGSCRSVSEFLTLLESTNGSRDTHASFGVIDSTGAAFIVEASRDGFWTYDSEDTERGFIVRTNFACVDTAGTGIDGLPGEERFVRSTDLVTAWVDAGELSVANLVGLHARDFSNWISQPLPVPCYYCGEPDSLYGCFDTYFSICSGGTVSAAVIQGVAPPPAAEPAWLTTFWVHLGQPACTVASPYWPVGPVPAVANGADTAPLCDRANQLRHHVVFRVPNQFLMADSFALRDGFGGGLWSTLLPAETAALAATDERLYRWRLDPPTASAVLAFEDSLAFAVYDLLALDLSGTPIPAAPSLRLVAYPNPFNPTTKLAFDLAREEHVRLDVHDLAGRRVARLVNRTCAVGTHRVDWRPDGLASGVYVARLQAGQLLAHRRLILVK